jgi:tRNA-modifying protein YgfZ
MLPEEQPTPHHALLLPHRGVLRVTGEDARGFLDGLITNSMAGAVPGQAIHAALLTPQGKIIADFFVTEAAEGGGFYMDVPLVAAGDLAKRLLLYKLRARIEIFDHSAEIGVLALWGGAFDPEAYDLAYADPRAPQAGHRLLVPRGEAEAIMTELGAVPATLSAYHAMRVAQALPEAVFDFALGDTFPHEINMDQLRGIDFRKGCYVGQEVVSRMEHRGTARTRMILLATADGLTASEGAPVMAGERALGQAGTGAGGQSLALVRLDRMAEALSAGTPLTVGGLTATPVRPPWWLRDWPFGA